MVNQEEVEKLEKELEESRTAKSALEVERARLQADIEHTKSKAGDAAAAHEAEVRQLQWLTIRMTMIYVARLPAWRRFP